MSIKMYSNEEKKTYVEKFKESGMSIKAFAKANSLPYTTLHGWLKQDTTSSFGEIAVNLEQIAPTRIAPKKSIVLSMENIKIELKEGYNKEFLKGLIEVLSNAY